MKNSSSVDTITLGMSGASGVPYTLRLLECLVKADKQIAFIMSNAAQAVLALETDLTWPDQPGELQGYLTDHYGAQPGQLTVYGPQQWTAPIASGSNVSDAMVICPCSSGCLSALATGASDNLLERAADVAIKEKRQLVLVHRETPLSSIHLENMLKLANLGATILPASPGFYNKPQSVNDLVDFVVARILDHLAIPQSLIKPWGE